MSNQTAHGSSRSWTSRSVLLAHLGLILMVALIVVASAVAYLETRNHTYTSTAEVVVGPQVFTNGAAEPPDMGTEKQVALSSTVAELAAAQLGLPTGSLQKGLSARVPVDTHVIDITYSASTPEVARQRAQAVADAFVTYRTRRVPLSPTATASRPGATLPATPPVTALQDARVISAATLPTAPSGNDMVLIVAAALVIGLGMGVAAALLVDRVSDRLRDADDLRDQSGLPVVAVLPAGDRRRDLVMVSARQSAAGESYRYLRARVLKAAPSAKQVVLLTSGAVREAKSVAARNLAVALAETGRHVVLVRADQQGAGLDGSLEAGPDGGSTRLLRTVVPGLSIADASDERAEGSSRPLASCERVVAEALEQADVVIVDAQPVLASADTLLLADQGDMVILVEDAKRSTRRQVREAVAELELVRDQVLGAVLVIARRRWSGRFVSGRSIQFRRRDRSFGGSAPSGSTRKTPPPREKTG